MSLAPTAAYQTSLATGAVIPIAIVAILALCAIVLSWQATRAKERRRRLELLEQALQNPSLSPETQRELVRAVRPEHGGRAMFTLGWFGLFGGIAWLFTEPRGDAFYWAVAMAVLSFACITLPLALRELEARRA